MYHKILVPLDGSKRAEKILPHVEELARRYNAKVILLQVVEYKTTAATEGVFINLSGQEVDHAGALSGFRLTTEYRRNRMSCTPTPPVLLLVRVILLVLETVRLACTEYEYDQE